jgi:HK97 family phage major capsid protein
MSLTTASGSGASILSPEQINALVVLPLISQSVAMSSSTVVQTGSHSLRVPRVTADATASWTAEGAEINVSDAALDEIDIVPKKLAGLSVICNELAMDSSPAALGVVGDSLVRDLARKVDSAFFGNTTTDGPAGLGSITTATAGAGGSWSNVDWAEACKSVAEQHNATVDTFACSPATALALATMKQFTSAGSNVPLLGSDPTAPASRVVAGVPLLTSPAIADNIVWALPRTRIIVALRLGTSVTSDSSVFFSSDRTAVRAIIRVSWGFIDPARDHQDHQDVSGTTELGGGRR